MRNILVFPDGSKHDFKYPSNRDVSIGEKIQAELKDGSVHVLTIISIEKKEKEILYQLSFS